MTDKQLLPIAGLGFEIREMTRAESTDSTAPLATAELVYSSGASGLRYDYFRNREYLEELVVSPEAIRVDRLVRGVPVLNTHSSYDLSQVLGVAENPQIKGGVAICTATFSRREDVAGYVQDVMDNVIRNVSVGYVRHKIEMIAPATEADKWVYRVTDWEPMEVSLVPIPFDMDSQVRGIGANQDKQTDRMFECEFVTRNLTAESQETAPRAAAQTEEGSQMTEKVPDGGAPATPPEVDTRAADIAELCIANGLPKRAAEFIRSGVSLADAGLAIARERATADATTGGQRNVTPVQTVREEMHVRMAGLEQAIMHRVAASTKLDDNGRQYRGMSLLEMGRDFLAAHNQDTRGMDRLQLATRILTFRSGGMMGTSDFSSLFANVANKRLRTAYDENAGTYALWARRAPNAPDFKQMSVVQLAGAPDLLQTNEAGEFKYGSMSDGAEAYSVLTYGRIVSLTRQAIINDDLRAFDRMVSAFGFASRRLENRTVYAQLTANAAMADGTALFHANHANLITSSALAIATLGAGRTKMRLQKGLQSEELNLAPSYLIVPATLEQTAYNLTSANYVPSTKAEINEFRAGGRTAVTPIIEPVLDADSTTAWYLAANSNQVDTVEYCYLDGADGPVIESEIGFETDGVSYKCRLDFAAKAIDHRGLLKATA